MKRTAIIAAAAVISAFSLCGAAKAEYPSKADVAKLLTTKVCNQCNLIMAQLPGASLSNAQLRSASLMSANLRNANLSGANMEFALLSQANLSGANLAGADLRNAQLMGANLNGANLSGANLSMATWTDESICAEGSIGRCIRESDKNRK